MCLHVYNQESFLIWQVFSLCLHDYMSTIIKLPSLPLGLWLRTYMSANKKFPSLADFQFVSTTKKFPFLADFQFVSTCSQLKILFHLYILSLYQRVYISTTKKVSCSGRFWVYVYLHVYSKKVPFSGWFSFPIVKNDLMLEHALIQVHIPICIWDIFRSNTPKSRNLDAI